MSILFLILGIILVLCAAGVVLTGAILWYERANLEPALLDERFRPDRLRFAIRYLATETLCLFLTVVLRPLGWFSWRQQKERERVFGATPVILLHGLFHNRGCWWWTAMQLRRRGFPVFSLNLHLWHGVEPAVEQLARQIEELASLGAERVHLVGHSMGGMIARACLQRPEAAARVGRCVLLGAPNAGSRLAPLAISEAGLLLLPGSDFLQDINEPPLPEGVRFTAIYSRHDNLVVPWESGRLEGARNVDLGELGHSTLLYHPTVVEILVSELSEETP